MNNKTIEMKNAELIYSKLISTDLEYIFEYEGRRTISRNTKVIFYNIDDIVDKSIAKKIKED